MATLGRIRNRSGLLLVVIGVGMLAFIGGDFMSSLGVHEILAKKLVSQVG
jgi:hypothetical protein